MSRGEIKREGSHGLFVTPEKRQPSFQWIDAVPFGNTNDRNQSKLKWRIAVRMLLVTLERFPSIKNLPSEAFICENFSSCSSYILRTHTITFLLTYNFHTFTLNKIQKILSFIFPPFHAVISIKKT